MTDATLTSRPAPHYQAEAWSYTVACAHATITSVYLPGAGGVTEQALVRVLLVRHYAQERCACTGALRQQYGLTGCWPC